MSPARTALQHFLTILVALAVFASPASAQQSPEELSLDELFVALKSAPNQLAAREITNDIWRIWTEPDNPDLAEWMQEVLALRRVGDFTRALTVLDYIIEHYPEYAEGWNQRATIRFQIGDYQGSLEDVDETLEREPRHFGALAGAAVIQLKLGDREAALESIKKAVEVHPFLVERGFFPELGPPPIRT